MLEDSDGQVLQAAVEILGKLEPAALAVLHADARALVDEHRSLY